MITSKNVARDISDISQARASQILKSFYELGLAIREKLPFHKGYLYHYKDVKDLKLGINKEIKPLLTTNFLKEWFNAKFKNTQPTIELRTSEEETQPITQFDLWLYIISDAKLKPQNNEQNSKINPNNAQKSILTSNLTNLKPIAKNSEEKEEDDTSSSKNSECNGTTPSPVEENGETPQ